MGAQFDMTSHSSYSPHSAAGQDFAWEVPGPAREQVERFWDMIDRIKCYVWASGQDAQTKKTVEDSRHNIGFF